MADESFQGTDTVEMPAGVSAAPIDASADDSSYGGMQDRMSSGDVNAWLSPSEGAMVDGDTGEVLVNPETGEPFKTQEEYDAALKRHGAAPAKQVAVPTKPTEQTAKPKTTPQQPPMSKDFGAYILGGQTATPDALVKIAGETKAKDYNNELIGRVDAKLAAEQAGAAPQDPVELVRQQRTAIEANTVKPLENAYAALVAAGVDPRIAQQVMNPIYEKQKAMVADHYEKEHARAMRESIRLGLDKEYGGIITKAERDKIEMAGKQNIEKVARAFYPQHGTDAFMSLVAGTVNKDGSFTRGPSAIVVDALVKAMALDKQYATVEDRQGDYKAAFGKLAANPAMAAAMGDIAHYYWLGKQVKAASKLSFDQGKAAATAAAATRGKSVQTKPASYPQPEDDKDMPALLRTNLRFASGR